MKGTPLILFLINSALMNAALKSGSHRSRERWETNLHVTVDGLNYVKNA